MAAARFRHTATSVVEMPLLGTSAASYPFYVSFLILASNSAKGNAASGSGRVDWARQQVQQTLFLSESRKGGCLPPVQGPEAVSAGQLEPTPPPKRQPPPDVASAVEVLYLLGSLVHPLGMTA